MAEPEDGHPLCCGWHNAHRLDECTCWHEEVRTISRLRPEPIDDPEEEAS